MPKLFSCDGHSVVKCLRNVNFEKMDTASYTVKNDGAWLLWGIFKEYAPVCKAGMLKRSLRVIILKNPYLFATPGPTNITTMTRQHT